MRPPEPKHFSPLRWLHQNLFNNLFNTVLTLLCIWGLYSLFSQLIPWVFNQAQWNVVQNNLQLFFLGRFPKDQVGRIWGIMAILTGTLSFWFGSLSTLTPRVCLILGGGWLGVFVVSVLGQVNGITVLWLMVMGVMGASCLWGSWRLKNHTNAHLKFLPLLGLLAFLGVLWLLGGGLGLSHIRRSLWGGLLLTLIMAFAGIGLSFPLGVFLALGRRSKLPVFRICSILYIEIIRGLPLIGILFSVQVLLPLLLPDALEIDSVIRAIAGLVVFSSAYLAENVRGGLQALPEGQTEAAQALGLSAIQTLGLIVLPQALKAVIPAIVGQFIGLFKDTSLLSLVGLSELMGMARTILAQPEFIGRYAEVYIFVGLIYGLFCYLMSLGSRKLEVRLASNLS